MKRTILWVIFVFSSLLLWDNWLRFNGKDSMFFPRPKPATVNAENAASAAHAGVSTSAIVTASAHNANATTNATTDANNAVETAVAIKPETITITTDVMKVDVSTLGGEIRRLELLKYVDSHDAKKNVVLFDEHNGYTRVEETGFLGLFKGTKNVQVPARTYLAQTGLLGGEFPNHKSLFMATAGERDMSRTNANEVRLVLESETPLAKLTKTLVFKKGSYVVDVQHTVTNKTDKPIKPSLYMQLVHDGTPPTNNSMFTGQVEFYNPAVYTEEEKFRKLDFKKIHEGKEKHATSANEGWVSVIEHFFVSAIIPQDKIQREIFTKEVSPNLFAVGNIIPLNEIAAGASVTSDARLYSGPQETNTLEKIAPGLDLVKDYWYFSMIAKPMFWIMDFIYQFIHNWGWTIVIFTILTKLALFPLSASSMRSMAKMKVVAPKMTALKEKFKNEPQKLNQAMMELYRTEKINPLGGCLPMLLQIPIFMSLYWVLQASVEMRGAPWMGWITDLTKPDPLFILPVIYMISMYITIKLNPAPADPVQAKVMLVMPMAFSILFLFFPSGLVLYWVVNNILTIMQQWVINNKILPPEHRNA